MAKFMTYLTNVNIDNNVVDAIEYLKELQADFTV
jgi:hypothetical protein